jgi:hypothetical protein
MTIISQGLTGGSRTVRIAKARNEYMNFFRNHGLFDSFSYLLVIDLDNALEIQHDFQEQLNSCLEKESWDMIASNRIGPYYDIWALRSKKLGIEYDCWDMVTKNGHTKDAIQNFVSKFQVPILRTDPWIPCESAFGGMALYKTKSISNRVYNGDKTCEHVSFNDGLNIFINPKFISGREISEHMC